MPEIASQFRAYTRRDIDKIPELEGLSKADRTAMKAVSAVLPFRVNRYVVESLIDWSRVPDDPMYRLTFPQPDMLAPADLATMVSLVERGADAAELTGAARLIQQQLNPHPAGQMELNVPRLADGSRLPGVQHKYRETVLFFPSQGQTCHAYCTYCFRWAQFVGIDELKFANKEVNTLVRYLEEHPEVTSVLITGGDPLVMKTKVLRRYIEPLLKLPNLISIRLGSKALSYWPQRLVTDDDADDLLRLFEEVQASGKLLALMGHWSHPRELHPPIARQAVQRARSAGAVIRSQAPLVRGVNDEADVWSEMWREQLRLGVVPYYMFVERDTGPKNYFEVPLARAHAIYNGAIQNVSGLGRTVRGPSMSATPGKVVVDGVTTIHGERVFALKLLQARDPEWVGRPFFARYDESATWLDQLRPALGEREFFFEEHLRRLAAPRRTLRVLEGEAIPAE